jgi:hypothetical protein
MKSLVAKGILLVAAVLAIAGPAVAQVDLTGDGRLELVLCEPALHRVTAIDGGSATVIWQRVETDQFGWAATAHPDLNGDGLPDLVISAPSLEGAASGRLLALSGIDGALIWELSYGAATSSFGVGLGVVPDQDSDGMPDILVSMRSETASGEATALVSARHGAVRGYVLEPLAAMLSAVRSGAFAFRSKDINRSGSVDIDDALQVVGLIGSSIATADTDFSGSVDADDVFNVLDEVGTTAQSPPQVPDFGILAIEDPYRFNEGYAVIAGAAASGVHSPPAGPCADLDEAARLRAAAYMRKVASWNPLDPLSWWEWYHEVGQAADEFESALAALNACRAQHGLPPKRKRDFLGKELTNDDPLVLPADPAPQAPAPQPLPGPTPQPLPPLPPSADQCPLDESFPPPTPLPGSPTDPCLNQWENNTFACMTCRSLAVTAEGYGDCLERAKARYRSCRDRAAAPPAP